ncbi:hypothetical protein [Lentzea sp. HUAS12]|uniref:hypothetical protein n=1 Tax=Lentzea sp. HUAS12 TaxID=2951806 RepID=UPI00209CC78D|nr:hypothetical protein [Lentzea sp. HUAS12]USX55157.1 hypothetical protein ND450_13970 [Lentzea sp. HUAS12]
MRARAAVLLSSVFAGLLILGSGGAASASFTQANCYTDEATGLERCARGYQIPPTSVQLGSGRISGKVEAVVNYPKSIGYQGITYLSGTAYGYTTNVCATPKFEIRHEFKINGFSGSVSWQGAGLNVGGSGNSTGVLIVNSQNQNWSLSVRANYPSSVTHNYTIAVTCNGQTAISGGSEEIPLNA